MGEAFVAPVETDAPETAIVRDMARRALWVAPVLIVAFGLIWGVDGAVSTAYAVAIVLVNFTLSAVSNAYAARISPSLLMVSALFGYLIRLALVFLAFWVARDAEWMQVVPFAVTILATHLGLLFWEMRYVSASLAFPGLKPGVTPPASIRSTTSNKES